MASSSPTLSPKEPPSPALAATTASPSPSPSSSPVPAPAAHPPAGLPPPVPAPPSSGRRLAAPCWSHEETLALIDAYRDKWYALRRGNLRANHWQEVADEVARRSAAVAAVSISSPKTSVQCRHKVEKLRKRYRNERQKSIQLDSSLAPTSNWVYFRKMDAMERGASAAAVNTTAGLRRPSPSTAQPRPPPPSDDEDEDDEDEEEEEEEKYERRGSVGNTRSLHRLMANGGAAGTGVAAVGLRFAVPKAVRSKVSRVDEKMAAPSPSMKVKPTPADRFFKGYAGSRPATEDIRLKLEKKTRTKEREADAIGEMVSALRMLGDGFMRIEQRKIETAREMEKVRMEMELKRTELILDSQRQIVDAFVKGFLGKKRAKISPEDRKG